MGGRKQFVWVFLRVGFQPVMGRSLQMTGWKPGYRAPGKMFIPVGYASA
jgi:hypothetical protein